MNTTIIPILQLAASAVFGFLGGVGAFLYKLGIYKNKVDVIERNLEKLEKEQSENSKKIIECSTKIDERTTSYASKLTNKRSPIQLNEKGRSFLSESEADKFVLENKDELVNKIKEKNPKSAYDIQVYAREVVESLRDDDRFTKFKNFVYQKGDELEPIYIVMSLYLRDIATPLLGFKIEEIDNNNPVAQNQSVKTAA